MRKFFVFALLLVLSGWLSAAQIVNINNQFRPDGLPLVIPQPQKYLKKPGIFVLPPVLKTACPAGEKVIIEYLNAELRRFALTTAPAPEKEAALRFELSSKDVPDNPEGYTLDVTEKFIIVRAKTNDGLFYGAVTLCNILRNLDKPEVPGCHISDYPVIARRCYTTTIQFVPSAKLEQFKKLIDVMAKLKLNSFFLEIGESFPYEKEQFAKRKNAHTREALQDFADYCSARHIKIIPSLQVLTHNKWMTTHADWEKMKEGDPKPSLWNSQPCIQNEEARRITLNCLKEQIAFFKADLVFVYMDEIVLCPFRECPKCKKVPAMTLLKDYMKFLKTGLKDTGARLIFCHDSFCTCHDKRWIYGDKFRRELNPKTDIIACWDYKNKLDEENFKVFKGFTMLGTALGGMPPNMRNMAKMVNKYHGIGIKMTHWYFSNGGTFTDFKVETPDSLGGFVQSSEYMWNCNQIYNAKLTYDGVYEMLRLLKPEMLPNPLNKPVFKPYSLNGAVNTDLGACREFPKLSDADLKQLAGILAKRPEHFRLLTAPGGKYYAMCLTGSQLDKGRFAIRFRHNQPIKFKSMALLTTCSRPYNLTDYLSMVIYGKKRYTNPAVMNIRLDYENGKAAVLPLSYRKNITDWGQMQSGTGMTWAVRGIDELNRYYSFGTCTINNPRPHENVLSISISTKFCDGINPAILALSLNEPDKELSLRKFAPGMVKMPYQPKSPLSNPAIVDKKYDFEQGMPGDLVINSEGKLQGELTYGVVEDPVKGKVLKITVPPAEKAVRVHVHMPFKYDKEKMRGMMYFSRIAAAPGDFEKTMEYYSTRKIGEKNNPKSLYRSYVRRVYDETEWRPYGSRFTARMTESALKDITLANTRRLTFNFKKLTRPAEIYLDDIGFLQADYDIVPEWTTKHEREQHH